MLVAFCNAICGTWIDDKFGLTSFTYEARTCTFVAEANSVKNSKCYGDTVYFTPCVILTVVAALIPYLDLFQLPVYF